MTALWIEPDIEAPGGMAPAGGPDLRLLGSGLAHRPRDAFDDPAPRGSHGLRLVEAPEPVTSRPRRRASAAVRRRRTLCASVAILVVALALPLSGTGGHSHATGSALAETGAVTGYTVQPGDTLWSIAERVDPTGDPRPLVARLAAQTGSESVVPGERILVP